MPYAEEVKRFRVNFDIKRIIRGFGESTCLPITGKFGSSTQISLSHKSYGLSCAQSPKVLKGVTIAI